MKKYIILLFLILPNLVMSQTPPPDPNDEVGKVACIAIAIAFLLSVASKKLLKTKI
jgi:hypothetical protein